MDLKNIITKLGPKGWVAIGGGAAAFILFVVIVMSFASKPSFTLMQAGLDPAQTGKITAALDAKGVSYQIENNGTALAVNPAQVGQARIALAGAGLLGTQSQPGMSLMDNMPLGASSFTTQVTYQRALEGQIASAIQSIQGVTNAQVNLVLPSAQAQLFSDSSSTSQATGAVLLSTAGTLDPNAVRGIAQLVASSVPGLTAQKVTITDGTGALLWPTSESAGGSSAMTKLDTENRYDAMMAGQADAVLARVLGPGKAEVEVNADVNANQSTADTLSYGKKGVPLTAQTTAETLTGNGATGAGGTAGSVPGYAASSVGGANGRSNYKNASSNTTYGVNKTVTHTVIAPGAINNQKVSILVSNAIPASEMPTLKAAVANAVGIQPGRDQITIGQIAFPKTTALAPASASSSNTKVFGYARYVLVGMLSIFFLAFVTRTLRRREREPFAGNATWLRELESPRPLAALEQAEAEAHVQKVAQIRAQSSPARLQIEDLVDREPDRVAAQVRAWMVED